MTSSSISSSARSDFRQFDLGERHGLRNDDDVFSVLIVFSIRVSLKCLRYVGAARKNEDDARPASRGVLNTITGTMSLLLCTSGSRNFRPRLSRRESCTAGSDNTRRQTPNHGARLPGLASHVPNQRANRSPFLQTTPIAHRSSAVNSSCRPSGYRKWHWSATRSCLQTFIIVISTAVGSAGCVLANDVSSNESFALPPLKRSLFADCFRCVIIVPLNDDQQNIVR